MFSDLIDYFTAPDYCRINDLTNYLNAFSAISFTIAAYYIYKLNSHKTKHITFKIFPVLLIFITLSSIVYHLKTNAFTIVMDLIPLLLIIILMIYMIASWLYKAKMAVIILAAYIVLQIAAQIFLPLDFVNRTLFVCVTFLFVFVLFYFVLKRGTPLTGEIHYAEAIFFTSILMRIIDMRVCTNLTLGTHFIWHIISAFGLYQIYKLLLKMYYEKEK